MLLLRIQISKGGNRIFMATLKTAILIDDDEIEHFFLDRLAKKTGKIIRATNLFRRYRYVY